MGSILWFSMLNSLIVSVANNVRSSAISNHLRALVGIKNPWKLQKWPTTFLAKKNGFWICLSWKIFFSSNFIIQLHLKFFQNWDSQGIYLSYLRMNVELNWIAHNSWKKFLFFLHETLRDYSLWNVQINLTDRLQHT